MAARTYDRLGPSKAAIAKFDCPAPHVMAILELRTACGRLSPDDFAIAQATLDTAAFHFTREARAFGATSDASKPIELRR